MLNRRIGLIALLVSFVAGELLAGDFTSYVQGGGDVLLCFRKSGGANDLVVDAGPVATLTNLPVNTRYSITSYASTNLAAVGTNGVSWSAFTWLNDKTLFMSQGRASLNIQSDPWDTPAIGGYSPALVSSQMKPVPVGASDSLANVTSPNSSATAVIEPDGSGNYDQGLSYKDAIFGQGTEATFDGSFEGSPELTTSNNFSVSGKVVRSDFYQIPPSGSVRYLGYFEFNTNGLMTYVAYPTAPVVQTLAATAVATTTAQLNASVNPTNANTTFYFQYGLTSSYGSTSSSTNIGTIAGNYGLPISSLTASTAYHFQAVAYNQYGTNFGGDLTFTTSGGSAPAVPVITYFNRTNNLTTIAYTTGNSGTYTFRGTNNLVNAGPRINWPAIASVAGDGLIHTNTDSDTTSNKFYIITAQ
jgi:hypothetical protein